MDVMAPINYMAGIVEANWWTSLFVLVFMGLIVVDRHQNWQRHRHY